MSNNRQCPVCENDSVCSVREARAVFNGLSQWGAEGAVMLDDADRVCSTCHAVRIDGAWQRMQTLDSRAWELAQASDSKTAEDYADVLTADDADDEDRIDRPEPDRASVDGVEW